MKYSKKHAQPPRPMKPVHKDDEAFRKALAAAPDERARQQVLRMREVIAAGSKKKLAV